MKRIVSLFTAILVCLPAVGRADIDAVTVQRSIDRGIDYLRKTQNERGGWNEYGGQSCGLSALCALAMVNSGVSRRDPDLVRAMNYLRQFQPEETYSVSLQTLVFCDVGELEDLPRIRRNVAWLAGEQKGPGQRNAGSWTYGLGRGSGDPSNAQFAVLALGAAMDRGVDVDPKIFEAAAGYWRRIQLARGGWSYGGPTPSGSMTCAGIASLIICGGSLSDLENPDRQLRCCGGDESDDALQRGLDRLNDIFTIRANPGGELLSYFYYLYAVERVGRLSGRRLLGGRDWYREGAERLVELQDNFQGFWLGGGPVESNRDIATSFALLFLAKGKRQVVVARMDHPSLRDPDAKRVQRDGIVIRQNDAGSASALTHPDALRQLVRRVEKDWGKDLTWQTIAGEQATAADFTLSPLLVIAGDGPLKFDAKLTEDLNTYLDQGGTILFDAMAGDGCGEADDFEKSVLSLCKVWFPNSAMERLPVSHPVWFAESPADPSAIGPDYWVYGVGACCRTPVFYSPRSLTCRWAHAGPLRRGANVPERLRNDIETGIRIGENILAYATGRELKDKLDADALIAAGAAPVPTRGAIPIALGALGAGELQVGNALPTAAAIIRDKIAVEVIAVDQPIALTDESLSRIGVLYLTGQTEFEIDGEARRALRNYIDREGIIIASPICGEPAFGESVRRLLTELAESGGGESFQPMPPDHPAWTTRFGSYDVTRVAIRTPNQKVKRAATEDDNAPRRVAAGKPLEVLRRTGPPVVEVMSVNGVDTLFYSPLDLSCALESRNSIQCPGYPTEDAAKIIASLILYSLQQ